MVMQRLKNRKLISWNERLEALPVVDPGVPVHLPADVDQQARVRRVGAFHRPQEVLLSVHAHRETLPYSTAALYFQFWCYCQIL